VFVFRVRHLPCSCCVPVRVSSCLLFLLSVLFRCLHRSLTLDMFLIDSSTFLALCCSSFCTPSTVFGRRSLIFKYLLYFISQVRTIVQLLSHSVFNLFSSASVLLRCDMTLFKLPVRLLQQVDNFDHLVRLFDNLRLFGWPL
jgi:hypothetical protein